MKSLKNGALSCSGVGGGNLSFKYSPTSVRRSGGLTFNEISAPGSMHPHFQFCKGNATSISLEFSVVTDLVTPDSSYGSYAGFFKKCCPTDNKKIASAPPVVSLSLGSGEAYMGIMQSYESSVTQYNDKMVPVAFSFSFTMLCVGG